MRNPEGRAAIPSILFSGSFDKLVSREAIQDYACTTANCTWVELPGAHAPHNERDPVRAVFQDRLDDFYQGRTIAEPKGECARWYQVLKR